MESIEEICKTDVSDLHIHSKRICLLYLCLINPKFTYRTDFVVNHKTGELRTGREICSVLGGFKETPHINLAKLPAMTKIVKEQYRKIMVSERCSTNRSTRASILNDFVKQGSIPALRLSLLNKFKYVPLYAFINYDGTPCDPSQMIDIVLCSSKLKPTWWKSIAVVAFALGGLALVWYKLKHTPTQISHSSMHRAEAKRILFARFPEVWDKELNDEHFTDEEIKKIYRQASKLDHSDKGGNDKEFRRLTIAKNILLNLKVSESDLKELMEPLFTHIDIHTLVKMKNNQGSVTYHGT